MRLVAAMILLSVLVGACSSAEMAGSSENNRKPAVSQSPSANNVPTILPTATPIPVATPVPVVPVTPAVPIETADGMEVYNTVNECLLRAAVLSAQAGFVSDVSRTINMGFYKVSPVRGLCDIHFLARSGDRIQDHEGKDSVLQNQVALYCPCAGPWGNGTMALGE